MTIKKLTLCILCFANTANLATEEDFNNENSSNSGVEEDILINKNSWNTRKWGDIYFLFPHLSTFTFLEKIMDDSSCVGKPKNILGKILNICLTGVVEYKWLFHKYYGINVRLNLNNIEIFDICNCFFSFEPSLEWIYGRKGKHIFSGSFSPLGFAYAQDNEGSRAKDFCKEMWTFTFILLKYEYDRRFYLNFGKVKTSWSSLKFTCGDDLMFLVNSVSIEFGLNIIGVNDWRKKRKTKC